MSVRGPAARGTGFRVGAEDEDVTLLSVLHGLTDFVSGKSRVEVPADFGTVAETGKPIRPPVPLLDPPDLRVPATDRLESATQVQPFKWDPVVSKRTGWYRVEIASDTKFNQPFQSELVDGTEWRSDVLPVGTWYYRITTLDRDSLEGPPTETGTLVIQRRMGFRVEPDQPWRTHQGRQVLPGTAGFRGVAEVDPDSSVVGYEYRTAANDPYTEMPGLLVLPEGSHRLEVRSIAADDHRGESRVFEFHIDATPPLVGSRVTESIDEDTGLRMGRYSFQAKDPFGVREIQIRPPNGEWRTYEKPKDFDRRATLHVEYRAIDTVGNVSPTQVLKLEGLPVRE